MSEDLSLSEELRCAREARNESLEQVHQRTGIALTILQGLESGDFEVVEPVYSRLAIDHYASYLGLDGNTLETRLREQVAASRPPPVQTRTSPLSAQSMPEATPLADMLRGQPPTHLATIGVVLVVGLAILLYLLGSNSPEEDADRTGQNSRPASPTTIVASAVTVEPVVNRVAVSSSSHRAPLVPAAATETTPTAEEVEAVNTSAHTTSPQRADGDVQADAEVQADPVVEPPQSQTAASQTTEPQIESETPESLAPVAQELAPPAPELSQSQPVTEPTSITGTTEDSAMAAAAATTVADLVNLPFELQIDAVDSTWVQVQWDDENEVVEIIPSGQQRTWTAERFFMVRAGRAHGVRFHFQGKLLGAGRLGDPTKVLRFHASAHGVQLLGPDLEPIAPLSPIAQMQTDTTEASGQDRP
jgi:cytoskeletal protein RodZ